MSLFHRRGNFEPASEPRGFQRNNSEEDRKFVHLPYNVHRLSSTWRLWIAIALFYILFNAWILFELHVNYPTPNIDDNEFSPSFSELLARRHLENISTATTGSYVARPAGSFENEVLTVDYIVKELDRIRRLINHKRSGNRLEIDLQIASGAFSLDFLGGFTSVYRNVTNVIGRLTSSVSSEESLLVNCHFDTVPPSPGSSDDAVSCALMMESLRVLAVKDYPLRYSVIFIFNGAEENILQGAHGFITSHPWAKTVKAFVNLEAGGAGGRELVFQTGPNNPWLIRTYAKFSKYPFASVMAEEVFQSGIIPSDTDFRIYRDYGNIPGIDIAYVVNGYVYHTQYDLPNQIPPGCVQRGGENLVGVIAGLANSSYLSDPGDYKHGATVFFDILGYFMIVYPARIGVIINLLTVALALYTIVRRSLGSALGVSGWNYWKLLLVAVCATLIGSALQLVTCFAVAKLLQFFDREMSWYNWQSNVIGVFILPPVVSALLFHSLIREKIRPILKVRASDWDMQSVFFDASLLIWTCFLAVLTAMNIASAYQTLVWVLFPLLIKDIVPTYFRLDIEASLGMFTAVHLCSLIVPHLLSMEMAYGVLLVFIPLTGRMGDMVVPDLLISGLVGGLVVIFSTYHIPLIYITKSIKSLARVLSSIAVMWFLLILLTPLGFPYGFSHTSPRLKRAVIEHVERRFYDPDNKLIQSDDGLWIIPVDHSGLKHLKPHIAGSEHLVRAHCSGPYCGWPYYYPALEAFGESVFLPGLPHDKPIRVKAQLLARKIISSGLTRLSFSMEGPDHITVLISPLNGCGLSTWSLTPGHPYLSSWPPDDDVSTYYVYFSYGRKPEDPWKFWIELQCNAVTSRSKHVVQIGFVGFGVHGDLKHTPMLDTLIKETPSWGSAYFPITATYDRYFY